MRVRVAKISGFCFGVERVIALAQRAENRGDFDTLGPIIHNPFVVKQLEEKGIHAVSSLAETKKGTLLIRAHGIPPTAYQEARKRGIRLLDGTCPYVKDVQKAAMKLREEGYRVVIVGMKDHPEVKGVLGYVNNEATVVSTPEEAESLAIGRNEKIGVVVQTTYRLDVFQSIVATLLARAEEVRAFNTRCSDTDDRQAAALELASEVDVMVVVGGKNSSNTHKLYELSEKAGARAYHIESPDEIQEEWFAGVKEVGVIGGASTPPEIVDAAVARILSFSQNPATTPA
ncbi:MAG: 4-hydroxy-3-methylbut-2-enyl diphosphate reductase [bacterium JZ-2024 1]